MRERASALISNPLPAATAATTSPSASTDTPFFRHGASSSEENFDLSMTICRCLSDVPSFSARNAIVLLSRAVRTQPATLTFVPAYFSPCSTISEISV